MDARRADPQRVEKSGTYSWLKEHTEDWLRQTNRKDPRSGRAQPRYEAERITGIQDKVQDKN